MKYKIIAMDFDGTLLTDNKKVTEKTENTLRKLKKQGCFIVGATARTLDSIKQVVSIDIFNYLIINNGVSIHDTQTKEDEWMGFLTSCEVHDIVKKIEHYATQIDIVSGRNYYSYKHKKQSNLPFIIDINSIDEVKEKIARMNIFLDSNANAEEQCEWINRTFPNVNCFVMQDSKDITKWLVINPKDINKAQTLKHLGDNLDISLEQMMFFGDGLNDLEVIEMVGLGVAMGNALPEVKEKATAVTTSNEEDGIAEFLLELQKESI